MIAFQDFRGRIYRTGIFNLHECDLYRSLLVFQSESQFKKLSLSEIPLSIKVATAKRYSSSFQSDEESIKWFDQWYKNLQDKDIDDYVIESMKSAKDPFQFMRKALLTLKGGCFAFSERAPTLHALSHFKKLEPVVKTPISCSRVGYWLGRTYEAMGKAKEARTSYQKAAQYKGTFYGQKAFSKLGHTDKEIILETLRFTPAQQAKFESHKAVKLIRLLAKEEIDEHILSFAYVFAKQTASPLERKQILALVHELAPHYGVEIAQVIAPYQSTLYSEAFPRLKPIYLKHMEKVDAALAHAVIRKESKFNPKIVSWAGAQGLMQLMPETAQLMADQCGVTCSEKQLLTDPLLNVKLGTLYLKEQLEKYDHSFPLTLASYNAGPGTVSRWLDRFPDPRHPSINTIDWIEVLPYSETRDYIHRVLENYTIYKAILSRSS